MCAQFYHKARKIKIILLIDIRFYSFEIKSLVNHRSIDKVSGNGLMCVLVHLFLSKSDKLLIRLYCNDPESLAICANQVMADGRIIKHITIVYYFHGSQEMSMFHNVRETRNTQQKFSFLDKLIVFDNCSLVAIKIL